MKFKSLIALGIMLVSLSGSGVAHAAESYDVSDWIKSDGTVETSFTYEDAPWIADDGTVDNDMAHYFRIANAEAGDTEVNMFYNIARKNVQVYKEKDRNSEVVEEFDLNDLVYIHLVYEDGWAWSGESQGYIPIADLSEDSINVTEIGADYAIAKDDVKAYQFKDTNSGAVAEFVSGDKVYIDEMHSDGWAYSEEAQGYIRRQDLAGKVFKERVLNKESEGNTEGAVTIVTDDYEITISPKN